MLVTPLHEGLDVGRGIPNQSSDPATRQLPRQGQLSHERLGHGQGCRGLLSREQRPRETRGDGRRQLGGAHGAPPEPIVRSSSSPRL